MKESKTVLIVEDEAAIVRFLRPALEGEGFRVVDAARGGPALELAAKVKPDVVLLDLGLPDMDGLDVLKGLRRWTAAPVIVLSARGEERDKISGLDAGADDYLSKPFGVEELLARIRVALRHAERAGGEDEPLYEHGDLKVDLSLRKVWVARKEAHLTPFQFSLVAVLVRNAGRVVGHAQFMKELWPDGDGTPEAVRLLVHQIRHRLERDPVRPKHFKTEPGVGYRLETE
ncbi:MAG TPA: response regulator [Elusimicrobiota bacterium]|nr:response regulator [Elusimicrobiota bacterium]